MKRQSFSAQICPLPTPLTQIKMHVRKELPLSMGDGGGGGGGGGVRWGSEIMCVCCKSHFPPFKQREEYVCNLIRPLIYIYFLLHYIYLQHLHQLLLSIMTYQINL